MATIFLSPSPGRVLILNAQLKDPVIMHLQQSLNLFLTRQASLLPLAENPLPSTPSPDYHLTPTEMKVLHWVHEGKRNKEIATILGMSPFTVRNHLERIFQKLDVETRSSAALVMESMKAHLSS